MVDIYNPNRKNGGYYHNPGTVDATTTKYYATPSRRTTPEAEKREFKALKSLDSKMDRDYFIPASRKPQRRGLRTTRKLMEIGPLYKWESWVKNRRRK